MINVFYVYLFLLSGIWLHVEGEQTPSFNGDGYVIGTDASNTLISDLGRFLDFAAANDVLVIPVLWNGALMRQQTVVNLVWDDSKLDSYINKALKVWKTLNQKFLP